MRALGCFPVYQGVADRKTIRLMEQYVKDGFALVIFPEAPQPECRIDTGAQRLGADRPAHGAFILPVGHFRHEALHGCSGSSNVLRLLLISANPFSCPQMKKSSAGKMPNLYNGTHHRFTAGGIPRSVCGK